MNLGWQGAGRVVALVSLLSWAGSVPLTARAYSPIPPYPGVGGVAVSEASFDAEALRSSLANVRSAVGAEYAVLVVEYTDRQNRPGPDYGDDDKQFIDSVVRTWAPSLDSSSSVLIVLGLSNHDVIVHPFSRFAALGWEGDAVKATIDASPFALYARSGDYAQGILALVSAIDAELEQREGEGRTVREGARRAIASARLSLARFEQAEVGSPFASVRSHALATELHRQIRATEGALGRAELRNLPTLARDLTMRANELDGYFAFQSEYMERGRRGVEARRREQRRLESSPRARDDAESRQYLSRSTRHIEAARAALRRFDPEQAARALESAVLAQRSAEAAEYRASFRRKLTHQVLPIFLLVAAFAFALQRLVARRRETRVVVDQVREKLAALDAALGAAGEKLLELENEHALFLSGGSAPTDFQGASEEPIRNAAARTDELFLAFEAATRLSREARAKLSSVGMIGLSVAKRVLAALTSEPFVVRTEQVKERKLLLPDAREIRMTLPELLVELEAAYARANALLEALGLRIGEIHEEIDGLASLVAEVEDAFEASAGMVDIGAVQARVKALDDERLAIVSSSRLDPLGSATRIAAFREHASRVASLARGVAEAAGLARTGVPAMLDASGARIATLRSRGRKLAEPGFDPDAAATKARLACRSAIRSLENGELEKGVDEAKRAERAARDIDEDVEAAELARTTYAPRIPLLRERIASLEGRLEERRARVEALRGAYSDDSLGDVLDNALEARAALTGAESRLVEAARGLRDDTQAYIAAKQAVDEATASVESVEALFAAVEGKAGELSIALAGVDEDLARASTLLEAARGESKALAELGASLPVDLDALAAEHDAVTELRSKVPTPVRELVARADALLDRAEEARTGVASRFALVDKLRKERDLVGARVRELGTALANSGDDGPEANAVFEDAKARFEVVREAPLDDMDLAFEAELRDIAARVETARATASADYEAAADARAAFARANESVREASTRLPATATLWLLPLRAELDEIRRLLEGGAFAAASSRAKELECRAEARVEQVEREQQLARERYERSLRSPLERGIFDERSSARRTHRRSIFGATDWSGSSPSSSGSSSSWGGSSHSSSSSSSHRSSSSSSYGSSSGSSSYGSSSGRSKW